MSARDIHAGEIEMHIARIANEFRSGFKFLSKYPKSVSIFGSSLAKSNSEHYMQAEDLSSAIARETGHTVITGGGPGIMEAANKGAAEAGGSSIGLTISLPHDRHVNDYLSDKIHFADFFSRKAMLTFAAEAYIFFPGGYGTLDELFSILTLIQTDKIAKVPVILFGSHFWDAFVVFMRQVMIRDYNTISERDLGFVEITDSIDRVVEILKKSQVHEWARNVN